MKFFLFTIPLVVSLLAGCAENNPGISREQVLPPGRTVKVTACSLAWGSEQDERFPDQDIFAMEFVSSNPQVAEAER